MRKLPILKTVVCVVLSISLCSTSLANVTQGGIVTDAEFGDPPMPLDGTWEVLSEVIFGGYFSGPYTWDSASSVEFTITDLYVVGDEFEVYDNDVLVLTTPDLDDYYELGLGAFDSPPWTIDADTALADGRFSAGTIIFAPGLHSITIKPTAIPTGFSDSTVAFRAVIIPAPGAITLGSMGIGLISWLRRRRTL